MEQIKLRKIGEIGHYEGPGAISGITFRLAGRDLGVTSWGMNLIEIEPGCDDYPDHDHAEDGQEEVYVVLGGSGTLRGGGKEWPLEPGVMVRVGPREKRKILPGKKGVTLLVLGGIPGKAYGPTS